MLCLAVRYHKNSSICQLFASLKLELARTSVSRPSVRLIQNVTFTAIVKLSDLHGMSRELSNPLRELAKDAINKVKSTQ